MARLQQGEGAGAGLLPHLDGFRQLRQPVPEGSEDTGPGTQCGLHRVGAAGGVDPAYMGLGVVPATMRALKNAGLELKDIQAMELNEAFAAQSIGCIRDMDLDTSKINPYGGGISLGHPIGATGAILTVKTIYELARTGGRYGLITMCIGGGQGIAMVVERV